MLISVCLSEFRVYKIIAKRLKLKILNTQRRQAIFFYTAHKVLLTPPAFSFLFFLLRHNFIIFLLLLEFPPSPQF